MRRLALASLALLVASPAQAYVRSTAGSGGACVYWGVRDLTYLVNQDGSADLTDGSDLTAVDAGAAAWNDERCSDMTLTNGGLTNRRDVGFDPDREDNVNLVVWRERDCDALVPASDPCWACIDTGEVCCGTKYNCWEHPGGVIAVTTTTFDRSTGKLVDADLELNGAGYWFTTVDDPQCPLEPAPRFCNQDTQCLFDEVCRDGRCQLASCVRADIRNTVTHEMGHVLGFDHVADIEATMFPSAPDGELIKRTLADDDIAALCDTYPEGGQSLTCFAGHLGWAPLRSDKNRTSCQGCGAGDGSGALGLFLLAFGLALGLALRRRPAVGSMPR